MESKVVYWLLTQFAQLFFQVFNVRAKASGSLLYAFATGLPYNILFFLSQVFMIGVIVELTQNSTKLIILYGLLFMITSQTATLLAQYLALKIEKGNSRIGSYKTV